MAGRLMLDSIRWNQQANVGLAPINVVVIGGVTLVSDVYDGGQGSIRGQSPGLVTFDGVPGKAKVLCCAYPTMRIVRGTRSAADGTYALTNLRTDKDYVVVAFDETRNDNAVIVDRVRAGP